MIPCVSLTETSVLGNMKERVKEMRVFGCRLNFWQNVTNNISNKGMFNFSGGLITWWGFVPLIFFSVCNMLSKNNMEFLIE